MSDVLQLNANAIPLSYIPLSVISWQDAIELIYKDKAVVLKEYDHWVVHSPSTVMKVPSIIIMKEQVKFQKQLKYSRSNVFLRDDFTCQLQITNACRERRGKAKPTDLTIDHVVPRSLGGTTKWLNVTTSCKSCNAAKGADHTIVPIKKPTKPDYYEVLAKRKTQPIQIRDEDWRFYIGWAEELIKVLPQPGPNGK